MRNCVEALCGSVARDSLQPDEVSRYAEKDIGQSVRCRILCGTLLQCINHKLFPYSVEKPVLINGELVIKALDKLCSPAHGTQHGHILTHVCSSSRFFKGRSHMILDSFSKFIPMHGHKRHKGRPVRLLAWRHQGQLRHRLQGRSPFGSVNWECHSQNQAGRKCHLTVKPAKPRAGMRSVSASHWGRESLRSPKFHAGFSH